MAEQREWKNGKRGKHEGQKQNPESRLGMYGMKEEARFMEKHSCLLG